MSCERGRSGGEQYLGREVVRRGNPNRERGGKEKKIGERGKGTRGEEGKGKGRSERQTGETEEMRDTLNESAKG